MVGHLSSIDTVSHLMVTNELKSCVLSIPHPKQKNEVIDLDVRLAKPTKIDVKLVNGTPFISINIYPKASILHSGEGYDFTTDKNITNVEEITNDYIRNIVDQYLYEISKAYNADIVGFSGIYAKTIATQEEMEKTEFPKVFEDSFFKIKVETQIQSSNLFNKQ